MFTCVHGWAIEHGLLCGTCREFIASAPTRSHWASGAAGRHRHQLQSCHKGADSKGAEELCRITSGKSMEGAPLQADDVLAQQVLAVFRAAPKRLAVILPLLRGPYTSSYCHQPPALCTPGQCMHMQECLPSPRLLLCRAGQWPCRADCLPARGHISAS